MARWTSATTSKVMREHMVRASGLAGKIKESKDERAIVAEPSREAVVRVALERGLQSLEKEYGVPVAGGVSG